MKIDDGLLKHEMDIVSDTGEILRLYPSDRVGKIWIERENGEGGEFDEEALFKVINKFFTKYF